MLTVYKYACVCVCVWLNCKFCSISLHVSLSSVLPVIFTDHCSGAGKALSPMCMRVQTDF